MRINGKLLALFASLGGDHKSAYPALANALIVGRGTLIATDLFTSVRFDVDGPADEPCGPVAVPLDWLRQVGRIAGNKADAALRWEGCMGKMVHATWPASGKRSLGAFPFPAADFPDVPSVQSQDWRELSVADWSKGGAVACAAPFASTDDVRASINGLLFKGRDVQGTDGHKLGAYVLASEAFGGNGVIVPLKAIKMLLRLVAETSPERLTCGLDIHAHSEGWRLLSFTGECAGYKWTVCTRSLDGADFPPIGKVVDELDKLSACASIPVADLRDLWNPFGKHCKLAIYRDGSVTAWGEPEEGIGTSLTAYAEPVITLGMDNLLPVLGALPKGGVVGMRYDPTDRTNAVILLGAIIMPMVVDMTRVAAELKETFGYVEPVVEESQQAA